MGVGRAYGNLEKMNRVAHGIYYTAGNPFASGAFRRWAKAAHLPNARILEPFAGGNSLIERLKSMGFCRASKSFDLFPNAPAVEKRDTLADFPRGFSVCVTNPPWLAKNSATLKGLDFPTTRYDDLYKYALECCLQHCQWVAALVPESFIRAGLFRDRLTDFVSLTGPMFEETGHPVGLALFAPQEGGDVRIWQDSKEIGRLSVLEKSRPQARWGRRIPVRFNDPKGNAGLIAFDNTFEPSIRFCDVSELEGYEIKPSSRFITKLNVRGSVRIKDWNECLRRFREKTHDVFLTSFKGIRRDGKYRRRLDWQTARGIIDYVA